MRRLSAILLITVFLFNLFGYRLLFEFAQKQAATRLEASLDQNEFDEAELITIRVPISNPYQNNQEDFERVDGELKLNGKIYKYVKRKISEGYLILQCLPDHKKMQLQSAEEDFFKFANDLVQNNHSKKSGNSKSGVFKNPVGEYDNYIHDYRTPGFIAPVVYPLCNDLKYLPSTPHCSPDQPPEVV